jgi:hypothetical protein
MPEDIKKKSKKVNDPFIGDEDNSMIREQSKTEEMANTIVEAAKHTANEITYSEINAILSDANLDKDTLEDIYDLVESRNVTLIETREPTSFELEIDDVDDDEILELELEEDDLLNDEEDEKKSGVIIKSSGEIEVSDSAKNILNTSILLAPTALKTPISFLLIEIETATKLRSINAEINPATKPATKKTTLSFATNDADSYAST